MTKAKFITKVQQFSSSRKAKIYGKHTTKKLPTTIKIIYEKCIRKKDTKEEKRQQSRDQPEDHTQRINKTTQ